MNVIEFNYFDYSEFECSCCKMNLTDENFILYLDKARELAGIPFVITSGYRCPKHNDDIGGVYNSSHTLGLAADIACDNSRDRFKIIDALIAVGFRRIGISNEFLHVDADESKTQDVIWKY